MKGEASVPENPLRDRVVLRDPAARGGRGLWRLVALGYLPLSIVGTVAFGYAVGDGAIAAAVRDRG